MIVELKNNLDPAVQAFFKTVFDQQYLETFGQPNDKSQNGPLVFTISEEGQLVAAMSCERAYDAIKINDLAVKTELQQSGLGSRLLEQLKEYASDNGVTQLILTTRSYQAKDFYIKHGFQVFGQLDQMPLPGVTTYYMVFFVAT